MAADEGDLLAQLYAEVGRRAVTDFRDGFDFLVQDCESPIERVLLAALIIEKPQGLCFFRHLGMFQPADSLLHNEDIGGVSWMGAIYPQAPLGSYRADFFVEAFDQESRQRWYAAVIECDGHDHHERTKEQARRDKRRDRWFQSQGIHVLRFAGSEIWADPLESADQAYEDFWAAANRQYPPRRGR